MKEQETNETVEETTTVPTEKASPKDGRMHKLFNAFITVQIVFAVAYALLILIPMIFGFKPFPVSSDSMYPELKRGDLAYVNTRVDADDIEVGDILAFKLNSESYATHRVVEKSDIAFITKGDANEDSDVSPVYFSQVVGETTWKIPLIGYIQLGILMPYGKLVVFAIIAFDIIVELIALNKKRSDDQDASTDFVSNQNGDKVSAH